MWSVDRPARIEPTLLQYPNTHRFLLLLGYTPNPTPIDFYCYWGTHPTQLCTFGIIVFMYSSFSAAEAAQATVTLASCKLLDISSDPSSSLPPEHQLVRVCCLSFPKPRPPQLEHLCRLSNKTLQTHLKACCGGRPHPLHA